MSTDEEARKFLRSFFVKRAADSLPKTYKTGWSAERAERARERCHQVKPWLKSTGPKTEEGKIRSSQNAFRHGLCSRTYRQVLDVIREVQNL